MVDKFQNSSHQNYLFMIVLGQAKGYNRQIRATESATQKSNHI